MVRTAPTSLLGESLRLHLLNNVTNILRISARGMFISTEQFVMRVKRESRHYKFTGKKDQKNLKITMRVTNFSTFMVPA